MTRLDTGVHTSVGGCETLIVQQLCRDYLYIKITSKLKEDKMLYHAFVKEQG